MLIKQSLMRSILNTSEVRSIFRRCAKCDIWKDVSCFSPNTARSTFRSVCKACFSISRNDYYAKLKVIVIQGLGGQCVCCENKCIEFLTVDHINGDGSVHRDSVGRGIGVYKDIRNQNFPRDKYRVLCSNCHFAITWYGYCPHVTEISRFEKYMGTQMV